MAQASEFGVRKLGEKAAMAKAAEAAKAKSKATSKSGAKAAATTKEHLAAKGTTAAREAQPHAYGGVAVTRRCTTVGTDPLDAVVYERRGSAITNPDGSVVFKMEGAEVPATWSQLATDIVISKYFRKAGLNGDNRSRAALEPKQDGETSVRQVVRRIARTIRRAGVDFGGYFATKADADTFEAELSFLLVNQYGAFNSPVWFNCGLFHEYGIEGSGGNWAWDMDAKAGAAEVVETENAYGRPQCSACFIQAASDDLMGIYDLLKSEARLFKYGSGTGTNFSTIRARQEKLSGGGTSSGLMSFLEVFDRAAGSTKSGGTTRRAAKMVCLDMDHPEIVDFINWKMREEKKAHALIAAGFSSDFNGEA
ncbi:MAG: vitamin B12-dependent ribonucleotide reductase, partial [Polyangiaceae bacterium]